MNITDIINMIATVGFPIVACVGLAVFMVKLIDKIFTMFTTLNSEMRADFDKQINTLKASLDNLTDVITRNLEKK